MFNVNFDEVKELIYEAIKKIKGDSFDNYCIRGAFVTIPLFTDFMCQDKVKGPTPNTVRHISCVLLTDNKTWGIELIPVNSLFDDFERETKKHLAKKKKEQAAIEKAEAEKKHQWLTANKVVDFFKFKRNKA